MLGLLVVLGSPRLQFRQAFIMYLENWTKEDKLVWNERLEGSVSLSSYDHRERGMDTYLHHHLLRNLSEAQSLRPLMTQNNANI